MSVCTEGWENNCCPVLRFVNCGKKVRAETYARPDEVPGAGEALFFCGLQGLSALFDVELPANCEYAPALQAVVENPEYQLAAVKTCPKCKGKGRFPGASSMPGYPTHSYINCRECRGKGLVMVDLEGEEES